MHATRRTFMIGFGAVAASLWTRHSQAEPPAEKLTEPVFRVTRASSGATAPAAHPLDEAMRIAREGLHNIRTNIDDYTATLVKRERINGTLGQHEYMFAKIRNRRVKDGKVVTPLSVYLAFLKPASVQGREVIYVEGKNDGKLCAHDGGIRGRFLPTVWLHPTDWLAMRGQRYPMTEIGIENLVAKLIERGETARQYPDVRVEFRKNARIKDRVCTVLQVTQPTKRPDLDFYLAQIFIDDALNVPVRYVAYDWPRREGAEPEVIEEYTYLDLAVNVGLSDSDFDPKNKDYNF